MRDAVTSCFDDALVQVGGHVVGGRTDQLDAAIVGLRVGGVRPQRRGQEGVVDAADDAASDGAAEFLSERICIKSGPGRRAQCSEAMRSRSGRPPGHSCPS